MQIRADEVRPESLLSCSLRYFPIKGTLTVANIKEDANVPLQPNFKKTLMHTYSTYLHMGTTTTGCPREFGVCLTVLTCMDTLYTYNVS